MSKILVAYREKKDVIRSVIAKYRSNTHDIEDLCHEVFLVAYSIELCEEIKQPAHLLLKIAKNLAIDEARRRINLTSVSITDFNDSSVFKDEYQYSPEQEFLWRQRLVVFAEAVASLPPELRRALVMKKVEGLKFDQIATRLNVSKSTVEKRVAKAMVICKAYIRNQGVDMSDFTSVKGSEKSGLNSQKMHRSKKFLGSKIVDLP